MKLFKRIFELGPIGTCKRIHANLYRKYFALLWRKKSLRQNTCGVNLIWHIDPTCYYIFPLDFYQNIKPSPNREMSLNERQPDVRIIWEQSRLQNTNQKVILDWIRSNPFLLGVNWVCTMEVAIRAINLITWYDNYKNKNNLDESFLKIFTRSLHEHAYYIENNWETSDRPNNHYIADLVGYFYLCSHLKKEPNFIKKQKRTYKKILQQLKHQIQPDGTSYEGSTAYHKLDTELFLLFKKSCDEQNITLPFFFHETLSKMTEFLHNLAVSDIELQKGNFVKIGDDDSGIRKWLVLLDTSDFALKSYDGHSKIRNFFTNTVSSSVFRVCKYEENVSRSTTLSHYPNFGLTIIKEKNTHITFRHPTYKPHQPTGHFHEDALSITLAVDGIPVLVDPGSYLYTANPTWRNKMRSNESHNGPILKENCASRYTPLPGVATLCLGMRVALEETIKCKTKYFRIFECFAKHFNAKQKVSRSTSVFQNLFQLPRYPQADTSNINENENIISIKNFYTQNDIQCFRKLTYNKDSQKIEIQDFAHKANLCWNFTFHPDIKLKQINKHEWLIEYKKKKLLLLQSNLKLEKEIGFYSPKYDTIQECEKLVSKTKLNSSKTEQGSSILQKSLPPSTHVLTFIKKK